MDGLVEKLMDFRPILKNLDLDAFEKLDVPWEKGYLVEFFVKTWFDSLMDGGNVNSCNFRSSAKYRTSSVNGYVFTGKDRKDELEIDGAFSCDGKDYFYEVKSQRLNGFESKISGILEKQSEVTFSPSGLILFKPFFNCPNTLIDAKRIEDRHSEVKVVDLYFRRDKFEHYLMTNGFRC